MNKRAMLLLIAGSVYLLLTTGVVIPKSDQGIENIKQFLDTCPHNDPAYAQIRSDFNILRNDKLVEDIACSEPVSQMPIVDYTDELIALQGLRVMYHMDYGQSGHLPWTSGTLYQWMKSKVRGINISESAQTPWCCQLIDGEAYIVIPIADNSNRDFDRYWRGISGNIALYGHEARHMDGYPHVGCCEVSGSCDQTYDENDLSPNGIQYWLYKSWLMGEIYVGFSCLAPEEVSEIASWHLASANGLIYNFCDTQPPELIMPQYPGGECRSVIPAPTSTPIVAGDFEMTWFTMDAGGNTCSGEDFRFHSTSGQLDAGSMSGGNFVLIGGFWSSKTYAQYVYIPMIQR